MSGPNPPSPDIADAIAALNTQIPDSVPAFPGVRMPDPAAQHIAFEKAIHQAEAAAQEAVAAATVQSNAINDHM